MAQAAEEATIILPVIGMDTISRNGTDAESPWNEWNKVLIQRRWKDRIPMVLVTKTLPTSKKQELDLIQDRVAVKVWGTQTRAVDVLCCDSLVGLGALQLQDALAEETSKGGLTKWDLTRSVTLSKKIESSATMGNVSSPEYHVLKLIIYPR